MSAEMEQPTYRDEITFCAVVDQPDLVFGNHDEAANQIGQAIGGGPGSVEIESADLHGDTVTLTVRVYCPVTVPAVSS